MAYYFIFPEKDNTIYSHPDRSSMNAGHDEILEIVKERGSTDNLLYPSRTLIQFKNDDLQSVISTTIGHSNFQASASIVNLKLTSTDAQNVASTINLKVHAISQSWDEGTGRYSNLPTSSNGCSWEFKNNTTIAHSWRTSSFGVGSTGSISSHLTQGGGAWYTSSGFNSTQQFLVGDSFDTNFDVTDIVKKWSASLFASQTYPTGIANNGFIIKQPETVENNTSHSLGNLQYFSTDTHTIYPPKLCFKWDDSTYADAYTGSAKLSGDLSVSLYRNKEEYNQNDVATFRIHVRDKYPNRAFTTTSNFLNVSYFTTQSYYSVRDAHTEEEIIPFDTNFTKLSADSEGMYFKLYMNGLQPERYYRVLFKHINTEGTTVYDNNHYFKIVR